MIIRLLNTVIVLLLLAACSPHTRMTVEPEQGIPAEFDGTQELAQDETVVGNWWEWFGDADLNRLIEEALETNLNLEQALARLQQSEAILRSASAARYPSLGFPARGRRHSVSAHARTKG